MRLNRWFPALVALCLVTSVPAGAEQAFDPERLDAVVAQARSLERLDTLIVARNGEVAFAESFRGRGLDAPVNIKSASKSLIAALVGIAVDRGILEGPDQTIGHYWPGASLQALIRAWPGSPWETCSRTDLVAQLRALGAEP